MRYDLPTIAHFAREGGFVPGECHTATAIAWVGSGGHSHLDYAPNTPGAGRYVGLWALDVTEWPEYAAEELGDPLTAARTAHALTERLGSFAWSAVWRAGTERAYLDRAAQASTEHPFRERIAAPIASHVLGAHAAQTLERLRSGRAHR